ncbi:MAG: AAA family ATPase [Nitrospirae bacterium]|nr:AAA family ATPase [Nitrospirota bacterium]
MEHLKFYNLKEQAFSNSNDNRYFFSDTRHTDALIRLKYAVDSMKGLAVVVGGIGTGKTTLARRILDELDEDRYEAALLVVLHSSVSADWLLRKIAIQLGIENVAENKLDILGQLYRRLIEIHEAGLKTAVLIDEAQMLQDREIMEEFRGLLNMEVAQGKLLTLLLFGLSDLDDALALDEPLKQRIAIKFKLDGFDLNVSRQYIQHRLKVAGCEDEIFTPEAVTHIHKYSGGNPRLINTICDNAILEGFFIKQKPIDRDTVELVAKNLDLDLG